MKKNIGCGDRIIRMVLAILFIISFFLHVIIGIAGWGFLIIGVVFFITGIAGFSPAYACLQCTTCEDEEEK